MTDKTEWPLIEPGAINKLKELRAEVERLNKENDDWHKASQQLREIIDAQAKTIRDTGIAHAEQAGAARLALDVAQKEIERLRDLLKYGPPQDKKPGAAT